MVKETKKVNKNVKESANNANKKMTKQEAGRKGGLAHHVCRGRGCQEEE